MPTTPDRPDGRPAGSEDQFEAAEAAHLAARETARVDRARRPEALGTAGVKRPIAVRRAVPEGPARRETVVVGPEQHGRRETVTQPVRRRPAGRARGAPLLVAAGFATLWAALLSYVPVAAVIGLARTLEGAGGLVRGAPRCWSRARSAFGTRSLERSPPSRSTVRAPRCRRPGPP